MCREWHDVDVLGKNMTLSVATHGNIGIVTIEDKNTTAVEMEMARMEQKIFTATRAAAFNITVKTTTSHT